MYFRIYEPAGKEHLVIESGCPTCAGDCAAQLVLGPPPWPDGYMDNIDYGVIEARERADLAPDAVVVEGVCTCGERMSDGNAGGQSVCERCEHGDHENCVGEPTVLEGDYTTCCCNASDVNVIYEGDEVLDVGAVA